MTRDIDHEPLWLKHAHLFHMGNICAVVILKFIQLLKSMEQT